MRVGVMLRFRDIIKPVAPARLTHALLRLHHYITKGGEGHVAAYFPPQRFIALHAGIEEFDQPQPQTALRRSFWICPAISMPNTAITLASSLLEPIITGIGCWRPARSPASAAAAPRSGNRRRPGIQRRGERPEGLRRDRPQFLSAGLR